MMRITGLLLAAGSGSRFGGGKLVHPLPDTGVPIAIGAWRNLVAALPDSRVVVRAGEADVASMFESEGIAPLFCPDAADGMGRSLAYGVRHTPEARGWVVALGDMPHIAPATIRAVADALAAGAPIAIPTFDGRRGHPVGLSADYRDALLKLDGDEGARRIVKADAALVWELPLDDPGILADIDTRADLQRLAR
ncbi:MAG: nucleotidyltransferase family protein [Burkholderiales bacterium]|nr:nucleotidyltransferase family protein [Burkholderiales bacterium]